MIEEKVTLVKDKADCCACGACENICPVSAINMVEDEYGFLYPQINEDKCIKCQMCVNHCGYRKHAYYKETQKILAGASTDETILVNSASGGIFATLAYRVINDGGVVYGSEMSYDGSRLKVRHTRCTQKEDIINLQGSKYVQSRMGNTYKNVKQDLQAGRQVLFSGTPCQVVGLYSYLRKDYDNLITMDIICHGVPNAKWFNEYIERLERKVNGKIYQYKFRDKSKGQGMNARIYYTNEKKHELSKNGKLSSFFYFFLGMQIYRENCYSCPYACEKRVSDITVGDFWGVYDEHAEEIKKTTMNNQSGISCILINSDKGYQMIKDCDEQMESFETSFEKVARHNQQLCSPVKKTAERTVLLSVYLNEGYDGLQIYYDKKTFLKRIIYYIEGLLPKKLKRNIKTLLSKVSV